MSAVVGIILSLLPRLIQICADAWQNSQLAAADLLAKLRATLSEAVGQIDGELAAIDAARAGADAEVQAAAPADTPAPTGGLAALLAGAPDHTAPADVAVVYEPPVKAP